MNAFQPGDTINQVLDVFGRTLDRTGVVESVDARGLARVLFPPGYIFTEPYYAYVWPDQRARVVKPAAQPLLIGGAP